MTDGASIPNASCTKKEVRTEVTLRAHHVDTGVGDLGSEDDDQETLTDLILREHRLNNRSDSDHPMLSSTPSLTQVSSSASIYHPTYRVGKAPMSFLVKRWVNSVDSDSDESSP
ncbi:hypothetical protein Q3G72_024734 [Acer saccharum]|nr:hypothetical protein Q3G72_024734 [Acer saccharum]